MATASGIAAQLGIIKESVYGTYVVPTHWPDWTDESVQNQVEHIVSKGMRAGARALRTGRRLPNVKGASGDIGFEIQTTGFGLIFEQMCGSSAITTPSGATLTRLQTFLIGDSPGSITAQFGRPDIAGVVQPFSYTGGRVTDWELSCDVDGLAEVKTSWDFQAEATGTALATATVPATLPAVLPYSGGVLTLAAGAIDVGKISVKGTPGIKTDRYFLGTALKKAPIANAIFEITGEMDCDFSGLTTYAKIVSGAVGTLVLTFTGALIEATTPNYFYKVVLTLGAVQLDGDTPSIDGQDTLNFPVKFTALDDGTNPFIKIEYYTTDTAL